MPSFSDIPELSRGPVLDDPTVGDLAALLLAAPAGTRVRLVDEDTGWLIRRVHTAEIDGVLLLGGEYPEMESS